MCIASAQAMKCEGKHPTPRFRHTRISEREDAQGMSDAITLVNNEGQVRPIQVLTPHIMPIDPNQFTLVYQELQKSLSMACCSGVFIAVYSSCSHVLLVLLRVLLQVAVAEVHHASSICCLRFTECSNEMQRVETIRTNEETC